MQQNFTAVIRGSASGKTGGRGAVRQLALVSGIAVLATAWLTAVPQLAGSGFESRMLVHVLVLAVAAPLIGTALAFEPRLMARLPRSLISPIPVAVAEFAVVWLWHLPILHGLASLSSWGCIAEQASFLVAGLLLWITALRPPGPSEGGGAGASVLALLMASTHRVILGALLMLAPEPLYTHAISSLGDVYAELAAQRTGGMMMLLGGASCLAGSLYVVRRALRPAGSTGAAAISR